MLAGLGLLRRETEIEKLMHTNINWSRNEAIQKQTRLGRASNCIAMSALRSGLHFSSSVSCCGRAEQKATARRRRPAQNTNNFNDNLNNKTIFSLNVTNRALGSGQFFLRIGFRQNDFLFFGVRSEKMKNVVKNIWLLWHAMLRVLARDTERRKNLSKRETRDRRRGSAFSPSRESILFFEKFY